jgi:hypothetical protein
MTKTSTILYKLWNYSKNYISLLPNDEEGKWLLDKIETKIKIHTLAPKCLLVDENDIFK